MQLRHLKTFVAISEAGTLTEAANRLYKTQGAVSHDLKSLEQEFRSTLIDRSGQRAKLTPTGQFLLPHAKELLQRAADIERTMHEVGEAGHLEIRVGVLPSLSWRVTNHVQAFRKENPQVGFSLLTALRKELVNWLADGLIDIFIADAEIQEGVVTSEVGVEPIGVVVHESLGADLTEPIRPAAIWDLPMIAFDLDLGTTPGAVKFFESAGRYPEPAVRVNDHHEMKYFIRLGAGYGIMPLAAAGDDDDLLKLHTDPPLSRRIVVARHEQRLLSPMASAFHDHIVASWRTRGSFA